MHYITEQGKMHELFSLSLCLGKIPHHFCEHTKVILGDCFPFGKKCCKGLSHTLPVVSNEICRISDSATDLFWNSLSSCGYLSTDTNTSQLCWAASAAYRSTRHYVTSHSKEANGQNLLHDLWDFLLYILTYCPAKQNRVSWRGQSPKMECYH